MLVVLYVSSSFVFFCFVSFPAGIPARYRRYLGNRPDIYEQLRSYVRVCIFAETIRRLQIRFERTFLIQFGKPYLFRRILCNIAVLVGASSNAHNARHLSKKEINIRMPNAIVSLIQSSFICFFFFARRLDLRRNYVYGRI